MSKKIIGIIAVIVILICGYFTLKNTGVIGNGFSDVELVYENSDTCRIYYGGLSRNAKIAYTLIVPELYKHTQQIEIPRLSDEEFDALTYALSYDNPDLICYGKDCRIVREIGKCFFIPTYTHTAQQHDECMKKLADAADRALSKMPSGYTDYNKELYIHDYICNRCTYIDSSDGNSSGVYGALINGEAVCEGYARAFQLLLNKAGIRNYIVTGNAENPDGGIEGHMWNVVTIGSQNYYVDVTWDDTEKQDVGMDVSYFYFNIDEKMISKNHFDIKPSDNGCNSLRDNYYMRNNGLYGSYDSDVRNTIIGAIAANVGKGEYTYEMIFTDEGAYQAAQEQLMSDSGLIDLISDVNAKQTKKHFTQVRTVVVDDNCYIRVILK